MTAGPVDADRLERVLAAASADMFVELHQSGGLSLRVRWAEVAGLEAIPALDRAGLPTGKARGSMITLRSGKELIAQEDPDAVARNLAETRERLCDAVLAKFSS